MKPLFITGAENKKVDVPVHSYYYYYYYYWTFKKIMFPSRTVSLHEKLFKLFLYMKINYY
jgi:hypothetical protein